MFDQVGGMEQSENALIVGKQEQNLQNKGQRVILVSQVLYQI